MTNEEVIDNLKYLISDGCTDTQHDFIEEIEIAIEALKKRDKYRWHDLRRDPTDLPSDNDSVYTHYECVHEDHEDDNYYISYQYDPCCESFGYYKEVFDPVTLGFVDAYFKTIEDMDLSKIIAWREIELFESEL